MEIVHFIYIPIILLLYIKTYKYNILIDDPVPRGGYGYTITVDKLPPETYDKRRSVMYTLTNITIFMAVCGYIHLLWGWKSALLFSVFPLNVSGVVWATGNYYMSSALLVLSTHWAVVSTAITFALPLALTMWGYAALNSTVSSIPYLILAYAHNRWCIFLIIPLILFIFGKRMKAAISQRLKHHKNLNVEAGKFKPAYILRGVKVLAYYIQMFMFPIRLGFFHSWGHKKEFFYKRNYYLSMVLCLLFWYWGCLIDKQMIIWWFLFMGIFAQTVVFGQFLSERYVYLPAVAFCILMSNYLDNYPMLYTILCTIYFCRSFEYIPCWRNNEVLFASSIGAFPDASENYVNLASYYLDHNRYMDAIKPLQMALVHSKGTKYGIHINLATCYLETHLPALLPKAMFHTKEAAKYAPQTKRAQLKEQLYQINRLIVKDNRRKYM